MQNGRMQLKLWILIKHVTSQGGTPSSLCPSLNIITHIKSKRNKSCHLLLPQASVWGSCEVKVQNSREKKIINTLECRFQIWQTRRLYSGPENKCTRNRSLPIMPYAAIFILTVSNYNSTSNVSDVSGTSCSNCTTFSLRPPKRLNVWAQELKSNLEIKLLFSLRNFGKITFTVAKGDLSFFFLISLPSTIFFPFFFSKRCPILSARC